MVGLKFGSLTVLRREGTANRKPTWLCRCDCGKTATVIGNNLRSGYTKTCGDTVHRTGAKNGNYVHGENGANRTPEMRTYLNMRNRCCNPNNPGYHYYGGRGIKVCDRWLNGEDGKHPFVCFLEDMGRKPPDPDWWTGKRPYWSIDRIDNDGDYEPSNCHWATPTEQNLNRRATA